MIEFLTLFMGLVSGVHPVELRVEAPVATVEIVMDGRQVEVLRSAPWRVELDFGKGLVPHELVAVARSSSGRELARRRQWVNVTGGIEEDGAGRTAVAIQLEKTGPFAAAELPPLDAMQSWFVDPDGRSLRVLAAERGPAEVAVVRDPAVQVYLELLGHIAVADEFAATDAARDESLRSTFELGSGTRLRFISARAAPPSRVPGPRNFFGYSPRLPLPGGLLPFTLDHGDTGLVSRIADAVAVAAAGVHGTARRRAVVLLASAGEDRSLYSPPAIREYLTRLQVPLLSVRFEATSADEAWGGWHIELPPKNRRGAVVPPRWNGPWAFAQVMVRLKSNLKHQRIVWLAGRHRPQDVRLSAAASGVRLAGDLPLWPPAPAEDRRGTAVTAVHGGGS